MTNFGAATQKSDWAAGLLKDKKALGQAIKAARNAAHLTQRQLAALAGREYWAAVRWEKGESLSVATVTHLAQFISLPGMPRPTGTLAARAREALDQLEALAADPDSPALKFALDSLAYAAARLRDATQKVTFPAVVGAATAEGTRTRPSRSDSRYPPRRPGTGGTRRQVGTSPSAFPQLKLTPP